MNQVVSVIIGLLVVSIIAGMMLLYVNTGLYSSSKCAQSPPDGNFQTGYILGPSEYTPESVYKTWTYDQTTDGTKPCAWKCDINHTRLGNKCILG